MESKLGTRSSDYLHEVDLIIEALGFEPEELPVLFNESALNVTTCAIPVPWSPIGIENCFTRRRRRARENKGTRFSY